MVHTHCIGRRRTLHSIVMSSFGGNSSSGGQSDIDPEMQRFLQVESQKAQMNSRVHSFTDICWDKCMDKMGTTMDGRTERCLVNCVERFLDTTNFIVNRLEKIGSK